MSPYLLWIPALIAMHLTGAWLSISNNSGDNRSAIYIAMLGMFPLWAIVSRYTKNILFDAMLYDTITAIVFAVGIVYFGHKSLSTTNMIGVAVVVIGLLMVKQ